LEGVNSYEDAVNYKPNGDTPGWRWDPSGSAVPVERRITEEDRIANRPHGTEPADVGTDKDVETEGD
jgi:hypothetical protein